MKNYMLSKSQKTNIKDTVGRVKFWSLIYHDFQKLLIKISGNKSMVNY